MGVIESFGKTQDVSITVLVDNRADLLVKSTETVKRFADKPLLAEHGFAALVDLKAEGVRVLWDTGMTQTALPENLQRMSIDPRTIDVIALSHGHGDHTGGLAAVLAGMGRAPSPRRWEADATGDDVERWLAAQGTPVVVHPAAFRERWSVRPDGSKTGPVPAPPRAQWEALGARIVPCEGPYRLAPGCWTTGYVPRRSFEHAGRNAASHYRQDGTLLRDDVDDDQAIVINLMDKGLVIVSGCAHSGILNTVAYAQEISGVEKVHAVLGGFHLAPAGGDEIAQTVAAVKALHPALVMPTHCSGFAAAARFAEEMPGQFVLGTAGTTLLF
jgi:7,8-dihydropterin-6-yl-methyl-4-(beta-D-ribofuranosyl)aminobenzene 5'-phosphate synthase